MITPNEIENKRFKKATRGYAADEVDEFLDQITRDYERLYRSNREQAERIGHLTQAVEYYQKLENTLNNALVLAEKTADERRAAAEQKAAQIVEDARLQGEAILQDAKGRIFGLQQEISALEMHYQKVLTRTRMLLEAELDLLEQYDVLDEE